MQPHRYTHLRKPENTPFLPSLRAPSTELYRTKATLSTGASAPSTSDMHLIAESPLSPTIAARHQDAPAPSFPESEPTSGIWLHIPLPCPDPLTPTQYAKMPIIEFELTSSEADMSWAGETEEAFSMVTNVREKEKEGEEREGEEKEWRRAGKAKVRETKPPPVATRGASGGRGLEGKRTTSRARRVVRPKTKEILRTKPSQSRSESPDPLDLLSPTQYMRTLTIVSYNINHSEQNLIRLRKNPNLASTDLLFIEELPRLLKPFDDPNWRLIIPPPTSLPDGEPGPIRNLILLATRLGPAVATQVAVGATTLRRSTLSCCMAR
ncbi:hypothetical protein NBRC10513_004921 [Rhodotorula toruloides]